MKNIARYFIQGLLIIVPLALTVFVLTEIVLFIGSVFSSVGIIVHPVLDFFIVTAVALLIIVLMGFMGTSFFFRPIFSLFENALEKAR